MSLDSSGTVTINALRRSLAERLLNFLPLRGLRLGALLSLNDLHASMLDCSRTVEFSVVTFGLT